MMGDLISRSALLEFAHNHVNGTVDCNDIARFPAVDAEPVQHGKWVWYNDVIDWDIGAWVCSECGGRNENIHAAKPGTVKAYTNPYIYAGTKFCPNCGAKMMENRDV